MAQPDPQASGPLPEQARAVSAVSVPLAVAVALAGPAALEAPAVVALVGATAADVRSVLNSGADGETNPVPPTCE